MRVDILSDLAANGTFRVDEERDGLGSVARAGIMSASSPWMGLMSMYYIYGRGQRLEDRLSSRIQKIGPARGDLGDGGLERWRMAAALPPLRPLSRQRRVVDISALTPPRRLRLWQRTASPAALGHGGSSVEAGLERQEIKSAALVITTGRRRAANAKRLVITPRKERSQAVTTGT